MYSCLVMLRLTTCAKFNIVFKGFLKVSKQAKQRMIWKHFDSWAQDVDAIGCETEAGLTKLKVQWRALLLTTKRPKKRMGPNNEWHIGYSRGVVEDIVKEEGKERSFDETKVVADKDSFVEQWEQAEQDISDGQTCNSH